MRIQFDGWSKEFILSVKNEAVSKVHLGADVLGNITRINNLLDKMCIRDSNRDISGRTGRTESGSRISGTDDQ